MPAEAVSIDHRSRGSPLKWLDLVMIAVVTFAVFTPVLFSQFSTVDDLTMLVRNKDVTEPTLAHVVNSWTQARFRIYMPLPLTIWQAISAITIHAGSAALPALGFKIVSIVCHCVAAIAATWTLSLLLQTRWPAIIGGLLFALHPYQVESVAWTTGLKDILCGLFVFVSIGCYVRYARRDPASHWREAWWWGTFVCTILAMCCKPTAMTLPLIFVAVDWFVRNCTPVRRLDAILPMFVFALLCGLAIMMIQGRTSSPRVATYLQPLVAADSYSFYLRHLFLPWKMCVDYARGPVRTWQSGALLWTWIIPMMMMALLMIARNRTLWLAAVLFILPIAPTSGIVPFDMQQYSTVADHYMYQPMLGVALVLGWAVLCWRDWIDYLAVGCVGACAVFSWRYAVLWQSPRTLFAYAYQINPDSWMATANMSNFALNDGDLIRTKRLVDRVLQMNPAAGPAWETLSRWDIERGRYRDAADAALIATTHLLFPIENAKRVTILGAALHDRELAKRGVQIWMKAAPDDPIPRNILRNIEASERAEAATQAASQP